MLKITTPYGSIKYGKDIEIPLTITNPMFNDRGSYSMPFTVPLMPNRIALGFPNSLSNRTAVGEYLDCVVEQNGFKERGTLKITDITSSEIELTLTTREGAFWEWAKVTKLTALEFPSGYGNNTDWKQRIKDSVDKVWPAEYFTIFPVIIGVTKDAENEVIQGTEVSELTILNPVNPKTGEIEFIDEYYHLSFYKNICPFLYYNAVIHLIAKTYGYSMVNELETDEEFNRACIIANSPRSVRDNWFYWEELVPDITVMKFIEAIEKKIATTFFISSNERKLYVIKSKNIITGNSIKIRGSLSLQTSHPQQIVLKNNQPSGDYGTVIKYTDNIITDPYYNFTEEPPVFDGKVIDTTNDARVTTSDPDRPGKIIYVKAMGAYFYLRWVDKGLSADPRYVKSYNFLGHRNRDYSPDTTVKEKNFDSEIQIIHMSYAFVRFTDSNNEVKMCNYVFPIVNFDLKGDRIVDILETYYDYSVSFPLNMCIYRGKHYNADHAGYEHYYPFGSSVPYIFNNTPLNNLPANQPYLYNDTLSLITDINTESSKGIKQHFWSEVETFFLNSRKAIEITNININEVLKHNIFKSFEIDGVRFVFDEIELTITSSGIEFDSAKGYTLKPFV